MFSEMYFFFFFADLVFDYFSLFIYLPIYLVLLVLW